MSAGFVVEGRRIGPDAPVFIIAEVGINHSGNEARAAEMVAAAAAAGADAVKFQTVDAKESYLPGTESYDAFKGRELSLDAMRRVNNRARSLGLIPFSTPGGERGLELMLRSGMRLIKVSSGLLTHLPLIDRAAATGLPLILSTGMAYLEEVSRAIEKARAAGATDMAVLHCASLYPAPAESLNLRAIATLAAETGLPVGYSDHALGERACVAAVAAGACIIEKHFTLDRSEPGADHSISAEPEEFFALVEAVREVERMLGDGVKAPGAAEEPLRARRHRFLVAKRPIASGRTVEPLDLTLLRVADGAGKLGADDYDSVVGHKAQCDIAPGTPLEPDMIEGLS